ncbi:MAG TPA: fumarate hydratase [Acholeplasmataceae bacterium]|nr:fumarate hydratase [Acholeplasmataceae bacterium]HQC30110.1 fumarate hydratase [Acholeplasmataceae bacterium]
MRKIDNKTISNAVSEALIKANKMLPDDVYKALNQALDKETSDLSKDVLGKIILNADIAKDEFIPMCQDTGMVVCFVEVGYDLKIEGDLYDAINKGVSNAYVKGYLRKSVADPISRVNTKDNTPAIIHTKLVPGDKLVLKLAPKGAGSENMSSVKMLTPAHGIEGIKKHVLEQVFQAGGKPCPPIIVGIGIGGNLEKSALLAKEALLRDLDDVNPDPVLNKLEETLLKEINELGVGPMGFGGKTTALAVKIAKYPTHIAALPIAVNIQCHAVRHIIVEL